MFSNRPVPSVALPNESQEAILFYPSSPVVAHPSEMQREFVSIDYWTYLVIVYGQHCAQLCADKIVVHPELRLRLAHFTTYFTMFLPATVFTGQTGEYSG